MAPGGPEKVPTDPTVTRDRICGARAGSVLSVGFLSVAGA
jgi:hypothetical protein